MPPQVIVPTAHTVLTETLVSGYSWANTDLMVYFAPKNTDTYKGSYTGGSDKTSKFTIADKAEIMKDLATISAVADVTFSETTNPGEAQFIAQKVEEVPGGYAGYADFPSGPTVTVVLGATGITNSWSNLVVHEFGHGLGLDHPFEGDKLPGVTTSADPGRHNFNNLVYTTMAYNGAVVNENPDMLISADTDALGAIDIAALQIIYGANTTTATGNDSYGSNGRVQSIWDAGGTDEINFSDAPAATVIDLRAATLLNEPGGGGFASYALFDTSATEDYAETVYTIANGVIIENAVGGDFRDVITGNKYANDISAGGGRDKVNSGRGNDDVNGGKGADRINSGGGKDTVEGGAGNDRLTLGGGNDTGNGGGGRDTIFGGGGKDKINGGAANDLLAGNGGNDRLTGGAGNDTFLFKGSGKHGNDTITDFNTARDMVKFQNAGVSEFDDLTVTDTDDGAKVSWDKGSILFEGLAFADVTDDLFDFV